MHELNSDGHEKLNSQVLQMGTVGIGIYTKKDKYSSSFLIIRVVPNARLGTIIGHLQLDFIEEFGSELSMLSCLNILLTLP